MTKEQMQNRIKEIDKEISNLTRERKDLCRQLDPIVRKDNTAALLREVFDVTTENSMFVHLYSSIQTTQIMDDFFYSKKQFLVFTAMYTVGSDDLSLIVSKSENRFNYKDDMLTMTDLKRSSNRYLGDNSATIQKGLNRLESLYKEIAKAMQIIEKGEFVAPFSIPIRVGGQTYNNQVLHDLVLNYSSPAELYGETTSFYIIGIATVIF